ncbi:hypothetical protein DY000_02017574 [Brassica cretica]|uniref:Uncharacterized protein n=1 Tax=Brassica cretica TaxID=69181 RepID=A0ABQ7D7J3_BRACR|nr:hypothetical protein DY000_02017574 [Brassica cretica]
MAACTRVAPLYPEQSRGLLRTIGNSRQTALREKLQIALFFSSFPPTGLSLIQCNSRPVMTRKGLGRLDKDLKTN